MRLSYFRIDRFLPSGEGIDPKVDHQLCVQLYFSFYKPLGEQLKICSTVYTDEFYHFVWFFLTLIMFLDFKKDIISLSHT